MSRQLNLDRDKLDQCYETASRIISTAHKYVERHSSVSIEKATLMLMGLDSEFRGESLASMIVNRLTKDQLKLGAAYWWGRALLGVKETPERLAEKLGRGKIKWEELPDISPAEIRRKISKLIEESLHNLVKKRSEIAARQESPKNGRPSLAVHFLDSKPKRLRSAVQEWCKKEKIFGVLSLDSKEYYQKEWRPENFRQAWGDVNVHQALPASKGLIVPELATLALKSGFEALRIEDWLAGEVDAKRSLVDLGFVIPLCAKLGVAISSRHADLKSSPLFCSLLLFEQMAKRGGLNLNDLIFSVGLPKECQSLIESVTLTQVLREAFSQSPLWLKISNADHPFQFFTAAFTECDVIELAAPQNLQPFFSLMKETLEVNQEFFLNEHGKIARNAHTLLDETWKLLKKIEHLTLWKFLEGDKKGLGEEEIFQKSHHYWNPVEELCRASESY